MNVPAVAEVLERAAELGITFEYNLRVDWRGRLTAGELARLVEFGPDDFWPHKLGMTHETYLAFVSWTPVCTGKNSAGNPCGAYMDPYPSGEFVVGISDRCPHHRET